MNPLYPCEDFRYERLITDTKTVSDTMVEIEAKIRNVSELPANADEKYGQPGRPYNYKYVVIKESNDWRIDSVLVEDVLSTDGNEDWKPVYSAEKKVFFRAMRGQ